MDELDVQIIEILRRDGRLPSSQVARELGVPEATIRYRIKRLKSKGVIVAVVMADLDEVGQKIRVVFLVRTVPGTTLQLLERLKGHPCVRFIAVGAGYYDAMVQGAFVNQDELLQFRDSVLGAEDGVEKIESLQLLKIVSRRYEWTGPSQDPEAQVVNPK